jgi:hypothetical protein
MLLSVHERKNRIAGSKKNGQTNKITGTTKNGIQTMTIKLEWHDTDADLQAQYREMVLADIETSLDNLSHPSDLCFHHVWVGEDMDGPHVFIWGVKDSESFHCQYHPQTEWRSIDDADTNEIV